MTRLSASALARAEICPGSVALPAAPEAFEDAARGTAIHAEREGPDSEIAFAFDVVTGRARELGRRLGRNYPATTRTEVVGTTDKAVVEGGNVIVDDYKSGIGYKVAPAISNLQLAFYALCATRAWGLNSATVRLIYTDQDDRIDAAELNALDLDDVARRVTAIWQAAQEAIVAVKSGGEPRVVTGLDHCWRCPCLRRCPAHTSLAVAFGLGLSPKNLDAAELTPALVANGWRAAMEAERVIKAFKSTAYAYASQSPIQLGNGKWLRQVATEKEELDGAITRQIVRDLYGDKVADAAVTMTATKTALEEALAIIAPPRGKAALVRQTLAAIGAANGIKVNRSKSVKESSTPHDGAGGSDGVQGS